MLFLSIFSLYQNLFTSSFTAAMMEFYPRQRHIYYLPNLFGPAIGRQLKLLDSQENNNHLVEISHHIYLGLFG
jgi:hypothetical protein